MLRGKPVRKVKALGTASASGHLAASKDTATQQPASESFTVRVYGIDTQDGQKACGLVEVLDGSGEREPFTRMDELGEILKAPRHGLTTDPGGAPHYMPVCRQPSIKEEP